MKEPDPNQIEEETEENPCGCGKENCLTCHPLEASAKSR